MVRSIELQPKYSAPSSWWEHVPVAHWIVAVKKPKVIVELGSHYGVSFFSFCEAAEHYSPGTFVYAIDTWEGDEHSGKYENEVYNKVKEHHEKYHSQRSALIRTTFNKAAIEFADESIDIVHIDGLHTYEAVKEDYENWSSKLKKDGTFIFHDWNVRERGFGVWRLWEEIKENKDYSCIEIPNGYGLGIATRSNEKNEWHKQLEEVIPLLQMKGKLLADKQKLKEKLEVSERNIYEITKHAENLEKENEYYRHKAEEYAEMLDNMSFRKLIIKKLKNRYRR